MRGSYRKFMDQSYSVPVLFSGILDQVASESLIHHKQSERSNIVKYKVSKKCIKISTVQIWMGVHASVCLSGWKSWILFDGMRGSYRKFLDWSYWLQVLFWGILDQQASVSLIHHEQSEQSNIVKWKVSKNYIKTFLLSKYGWEYMHWSVCLEEKKMNPLWWNKRILLKYLGSVLLHFAGVLVEFHKGCSLVGSSLADDLYDSINLETPVSAPLF